MGNLWLHPSRYGWEQIVIVQKNHFIFVCIERSQPAILFNDAAR